MRRCSIDDMLGAVMSFEYRWQSAKGAVAKRKHMVVVGLCPAIWVHCFLGSSTLYSVFSSHTVQAIGSRVEQTTFLTDILSYYDRVIVLWNK